MSRKIIELTGRKFGNLTVLDFVEIGKGHRCAMWRCLCLCGRIKVIRSANLLGGRSRSCGCLMPELVRRSHLRHGMSDTSEWIAWSGMRQRCYKPKQLAYKNYGARGIKVCDRWLGPDGFDNFITDVGRKPGPEYSLDRYPNNDGDYEPNNVRWATPIEQANNKRRSERSWGWETFAESIG